MNDDTTPTTGGCLCGALRYEALAQPLYAGHCYCVDCQKASGSGFIPFLGFPARAVRLSGESRPFITKSSTGGDATRNSCPVCNSLVFGGERDQSETYTMYAGTLDDPSAFVPKIAIFTRTRPPWAIIPPGLTVFPGHPSAGGATQS